MNKKQIARLGGFITLAAMAFTGIAFVLSGATAVWPYLYIFAIASWLHGICWGYRFALEGGFTWL